MNLYGMAAGLIGAVNESYLAVWQQSSGYTTDDAGNRTPEFTTRTVSVQVQALSARDLQTAGLYQTQEVTRSVYLQGDVVGLVRADKTGGDILIFPQGPNRPPQPSKVVKVLEPWNDWCRVAVCLQS